MPAIKPEFEIEIRAPLKGVVRATTFQEQPEFTAFDARNFVPFDCLDGRDALATRPPLVAFDTPSSQPVNMLATLNLPSPTLFAAAGGKLYKRGASSWSQISSSVSITSTRAVQAAPYIKELFIATDDTPLVYNDDDGTLLEWEATVGTVPSDCRIIATYEGCLVLAGAPAAPHQLFMSRVGKPYDFNFAEADSGAAVPATFEGFGLLIEPITALIPFNNRLLICTENSIFQLTGHPRQGGKVEQVTAAAGVLGPNAWARVLGERDRLFVLSRQGLTHIETAPLTSDAVATPISAKVIPDDLRGLVYDADDPTICMAWEPRYDAVLITDRADPQQAWWYDNRYGGLWPQTFDSNPWVLHRHDALMTADAGAVFFAGTAYGGLARFDRTGSEDFVQGTYATVGPVPLSLSPQDANMITEAMLIFGGGTQAAGVSDNVAFHVGRTAEAAAARSDVDAALYRYKTSVERVSGNLGRCWPQLAGHALALKLSQPAGNTGRIVFESARLKLRPNGKTIDTGHVAPYVTTTPGQTLSMEAD